MLTRPSQSSSSRFGEFGSIVVLKRNGEDGSVFKINYETVRIGKNDASLDIRVQNDAVSPIHCLLEVNKDTKKILCRSSNPKNQAVLNGEFVSVQGKILSSGDILRIGTRNFRFEYNSNWTQGLGINRRSRSLGRSQSTLETEQQNTFSQRSSVAVSSADLSKPKAVTSRFILQPKISTSIEENTANNLVVKPNSVEQSPAMSMEKRTVETSNEKLRRRRSKETRTPRQSLTLKTEKIAREEVESTNSDSVFAESIDMLEKNLAKVVNKRKSAIAARELKQASQKGVSRNRLSLPVINLGKNLSGDKNKQSSKANRSMSIKRVRVSLSAKNSGGSREERVETKEMDLCSVTSTGAEEIMKQDGMDEPPSAQKEIETTKLNEPFTNTIDLCENRNKLPLSSKRISRHNKVSGEEIRKSSDTESGWRLSRRSLKESAGNSEPTTETSPLNSEKRLPSVVDTNAIANSSIDLLDIDQNEPLDNQDYTAAFRSSRRIAKKTTSSSSYQEDHLLNNSIEPLNLNKKENQLMDSQDSIYDQELSRESIKNRLSFRGPVAKEDDFVTNGNELLDVDRDENLHVSGQDYISAILPSSSEEEASPSKRRASSNRSGGRQHINEFSPKNSQAENASTKESTFLAEDISVLEPQDLQSHLELEDLRNQTFSTEDVSMISVLDSCSSSSLTMKDKVSTHRLTLGKKEVVVAPADSTTPRLPRSSLISGTKPDKMSLGQASVRSTMHNLHSFPASVAPCITPGLSRLQTRRSVSFGPQLSPEYVDSRLPPSTPIKRGTKPMNLSMTQPRLIKKRVDEIPSSLFKMRDNKPLPISKKKVLKNVTEGSVEEKRKSSVGGKKLFSEVLKAAKTPKVKRLQHVTPTKFYNKTDKAKKKTILHDERKVVNLGNVTPRSKPVTTGHANSPITYVIGKKRTSSAENLRLESSKKLKHGSPSPLKTEERLTLARKGTPKANYQNVQSIKELTHLPKDRNYSQVAGVCSTTRKSTPNADYRSFKGLKRLLHPPKSPDYSKVEGVRSVLRQRTPKADYRNVKGLKELMNPPNNPDYSKVEGVRSVLRQHTPKANYQNVKGLKELMNPPKESNLEDISAVKRFLRGSTPRGSYQDLEGVKELMQSPVLKQPKPRSVSDVGFSNDEENELDSYIKHITSARVQLEPLKIAEGPTAPKKDKEVAAVSSKRMMRNEAEDSKKVDIANGTLVTATPKLTKKTDGRPAKAREDHDFSTKGQVSPGERSPKETRGNKNVQSETKEKEVSTRKSLNLNVVPIQSKKTAETNTDNLGKRKGAEEIEATDRVKEELTVRSKRIILNKDDDLEEKEIASSAKTTPTSKRQAKTTRNKTAEAAEGHLVFSKEEVSPAKPSLRKTRSKRPVESEKKVTTYIDEEIKATNKGKEVRGVPSKKMTRNKPDESEKEEGPSGAVTTTTSKLEAKRSRGRSAKPTKDHAVSTKNPVSPAKPSPKKTRRNEDMQSEPKEKEVSTRIDEEIKATNKGKEVRGVPSKMMTRNKPDESEKEEGPSGAVPTTTPKLEAKRSRGRSAKPTKDHAVSTKNPVSPAKPSKKTRSNKDMQSEPKEKEVSRNEEEMEATNKGKEVRGVPGKKRVRNKPDESEKEEGPVGAVTTTTPKLEAKRSRGRSAKTTKDRAVSTKNPVSPAKPSPKKTRSNKDMQSEPKEKGVSKKRPLNPDVVSPQGKKTVRIQADYNLGKSKISKEIKVTNTKKEVPIVQSKRGMRNKPDNLKKTKNEVETTETSKVQAKTASGRKGKDLGPDDVSPKERISPAKPSSKKTRSKKVLQSEPKKKEASKRSTKEERRATPPGRALRTRR